MTESNRREFLIATAAIGGGMALSLYLPEARAEDQIVASRVNSRPWLPPEDGGVEVNPWIVIRPDDHVVIRVNQVAVGTLITERPPHRSRRALLTHRAPPSGGTSEAHAV